MAKALVPQLNSLIGLNLIKKKSLLSGKEINFLRKNMGLTATKLSLYIGVDNATISRWENGTQNISKPHDYLLRLVYSSIKSIPAEKIKHLIEKDFKEIKPKQKKISKYKIPWPQSEADCMISV
ncbi:MAG: helix-turn-helix domain-containing protein [Thermodesulfobacteriota bacterium]|nr:helix-turn-helix domain-containing protein [Thermodesulfobacteriota bacterium]